MHPAAVAARERRRPAGLSAFPQSTTAARTRTAEAGHHASGKEGQAMLLAFEAEAERCWTTAHEHTSKDSISVLL
jgi:hypothetical protein